VRLKMICLFNPKAGMTIGSDGRMPLVSFSGTLVMSRTHMARFSAEAGCSRSQIVSELHRYGRIEQGDRVPLPLARSNGGTTVPSLSRNARFAAVWRFLASKGNRSAAMIASD
jgi:hypothetical protein